MKYIHGQIVTHSLLVLYWGAMAMTGAAKRRNISRGPISEGKMQQLTDDEKTDDALETMLRHIHFVRECCELLPSMEKE